jgi:hypothetical protein
MSKEKTAAVAEAKAEAHQDRKDAKAAKEAKASTVGKPSPKGIKVIPIKKEFDVALTDAEYAAKGKQAAALKRVIDDTNQKWLEKDGEFKAKVKAKSAERDELLDVINLGTEKRLLDVGLERDYEGKRVRYHHAGMVIEDRVMTDDELQTEMDLRARHAKGDTRGARVPKQHLKRVSSVPPVIDGQGKPVDEKTQDIQDAIRQETRRGSKTSAVDGPTRDRKSAAANDDTHMN